MNSHMKMVFAAFLHALVWSLLLVTSTISLRSDIYCLESIKESLEDPFNYFTSWDFNNHTQGFICKFTGIECWHPDENKVLAIMLSDMGLKGQFPRGIENCTSLIRLDLSSNNLFGPIPSDISTIIQYVTSLDLSYNNFSGEIPRDIANCSYLNVLKLDHNSLTGQIPPQLGQLNRIKTFSVANNFLSGRVPFINTAHGAESYANNPGLCGHPLNACNKDTPLDLSLFKSGFAVGYVIAITLVLVFFMLLFYMPAKNNMVRKNTEKKKEAIQRRQRPVNNVKRKEVEISTMERLVTRMSFAGLNKATDNFNEDNVIGLGKTGTMYKAMLANGWFVAVKRLCETQLFENQFTSELLILGSLKHRNIIPLLGFCTHLKERLLVYKYMSNGSLYDRLYPRGSEAMLMDWPSRVKVAFGLARGLRWLHYNNYFRVVHLNITSKCILLDMNFEPKISNFGRSMFRNLNHDTGSSRSSHLREFWELDLVKKDVYRFGLVLLELITGKNPRKVANSASSFIGTDQNEWFSSFLSCSFGLYDHIDKSLIGQGFDREIFHLLKVGCNCVQRVPDRRPTMLQAYKTMLQVYKTNRTVAERYGLTDNSEILEENVIAAANSRGEFDEIEITETQ